MSLLELPRELEEHARELHQEAFIFDACNPTMGFFKDEKAEVKALVEGQIDGSSITVANQMNNFATAVEAVVQHRKLADRNAGAMRICTSVAELEQCEREGKIGLVIHFQDAKPIEDNLDYLAFFQSLGLRIFQLTYNVQGFVGTGCCERHDQGLSYFGLEVVEECNRLRLLIDLSHCGHGTSWEAMKHSKAPVAFTHSGAYSLVPGYGRCKPDDMLKALADMGGVVGVTFFPPFVKRDPKTHLVLQGTVHDVLNMIDHVVKIVGIDHVGIGTDLSNYFARTREMPANSSIKWFRANRPDVFGAGPTDTYDRYPIGLESHSEMLNLTRGLVQRGYRDEDVKKILGGNWLRLFREVWGG